MRPMIFALACSALFLASTREAVAFDYTLQPSATQIALAPGAQAEIALDIGNPTSTASPTLHFRIGSWSDYDLELTPQESCGSLQFETSVGQTTATSQIPSVPAGGVRRCVLHATRHIDSKNNLNILVSLSEVPPTQAGSASQFVMFGTFIDVALFAELQSSEVDAAGVVHTIYRVGARNNSGLDIEPVSIALGDTCTIEPIEIEADMPGGCTLIANECGFTGGPGKQTPLAALAAGQANSCLVRLSDEQSANSSLRTYVGGAYFGSYREIGTGLEAADSDLANNQLQLDVNAPAGTPPPSTQLPTLSTWALFLLGMVIVVSAFRVVRRRSA